MIVVRSSEQSTSTRMNQNQPTNQNRPIKEKKNNITTNKMKGQSEIAYLPKFVNMMLIVMVIVITEILYIILIFDVTYWNCSPIPYVDQVWRWYVKAFMSYAWQNWQTNRQTDRQTDRQMKGQSEIAYLPKFANMMLIVMVIVITEILYITLICDCFENQ